MAELEIEGATKYFPLRGRRDSSDDRLLVFDDLTFNVEQGELVCFLGPSGCGKTTLLWSIAGLHELTSGKIRVRGEEISGPSSDRSVVFQEFVMFPWRTIAKNVSMGLELRKNRHIAKNGRSRLIEDLIDFVELRGCEKSYPHEVSQGMRQRVSVARALAVEPTLLLMDEPFGSLDVVTREAMQTKVIDIARKKGKTIIFVTHSIDEALFIADKIVVFSARPARVKEIITFESQAPRYYADHKELLPLKERIETLLFYEMQ
jgi:NitT/TauT family transport system ATP-binding protein